jgi:hypothetical protein
VIQIEENKVSSEKEKNIKTPNVICNTFPSTFSFSFHNNLLVVRIASVIFVHAKKQWPRQYQLNAEVEVVLKL